MVTTSVFVLEADWRASPIITLSRDERWRLEAAFEQDLDPDELQTVSADVHGASKGPIPDYPPLSDVGPCFSARAADSLASVLAGNGRLYPMRVNDATFYAYHLKTILPALDNDASKFEMHPAGGVFLIRAHVFMNDALDGASIFTLPTKAASAVYVTGQFVELVSAGRLTGFVFHPVWDGSSPIVGSGLLGGGW